MQLEEERPLKNPFFGIYDMAQIQYFPSDNFILITTILKHAAFLYLQKTIQYN